MSKALTLAPAMRPCSNRGSALGWQARRHNRRRHQQWLLMSMRRPSDRAGELGNQCRHHACQKTRHEQPPICRQPVKPRLLSNNTSRPFGTWHRVEMLTAPMTL